MSQSCEATLQMLQHKVTKINAVRYHAITWLCGDFRKAPRERFSLEPIAVIIY